MKIKDALNDNEFAKYLEFVNEHKGISKVTLTPTNIATNVMVTCSVCREIKDITDYDCW